MTTIYIIVKQAENWVIGISLDLSTPNKRGNNGGKAFDDDDDDDDGDDDENDYDDDDVIALKCSSCVMMIRMTLVIVMAKTEIMEMG